MKLDDVKVLIKQLENPKRRSFDEKLNPGIKDIYGLTMPQIKNIANQIYKNDPILFLETNDFSCYELKQLQAMVIAKLKDIDTALSYFKKFIPFVNGWAVNDTLCSYFKQARRYREKVFNFLSPYFKSDKEFEQRIVSVMFLCHFLVDDYIDQVIDILDQQKLHDYYAKMGVAWAFATILAKYPDKGMSYMKDNQLDKWTYKKAIQKAIESFRVSDDIKLALKSMRNMKG